MLDREELRKYFTEDQIQDLLDLEELCDKITPGRIRRNRVRKIDPNHIPRPINSFMTYRTEKQALIRKFCPTANHREISKMVAKWWHNLSSSQKSSYVEQAKHSKAAHTKKYPDYIFRPKPKKVSAKKSTCTTKIDLNDTSNLKVKDDEITQQSKRGLTASGTNCYHPTVYTEEQQHFHTNNYYSNIYGFNGFATNNNVHPSETVYHSRGSRLPQVYNHQQSMSTQFIPGSYLIHPSQELYYGHAVSYYPSPVDKSPSVALIQTTCNPALISDNSTNVNHAYATPSLDDEITPLSQAMSTPILGYPSTPFVMNADSSNSSYQRSPAKDFISKSSCFYEDFSLYSDMNPTLSTPADIKPTLLGDCDFWGNSAH